MNVERRTTNGFLWAYTSLGGDKLLSLLTTMILTRVLLPAEIGTVAVAMLCIGLIDATRDLGIRDALTYGGDRGAAAGDPVGDPAGDPGVGADTAFFLSLGLGALQTAGALLLAPLVGDWVGNGRVETILQLLAPVFLFNALGSTHDALLQKRLEIRRCYRADLASALVRTAVTLACILAGLGIWSIVAGFLTGAACRTAGRWWLLRWRPRLRFDGGHARALLGYGMHVTLVTVASPLLGRADQMAIMTFLNETALGFYTVALRLPEVLLGNINVLVSRIMFPVYVHIRNDPKRLEACLFATMRGMVMVMAPAALGMAVVAPELLPLVFGGQWAPAVPLLRIFALTMLVDTVPWTTGDLFKAVGRPHINSRLLVVETVYTAPIVWLATQASQDLLVAASTLLGCRAVAVVIRLVVAVRVLRFPLARYREALGGVAVAALVMMIGLLAWRSAAAELPAPVLLVSSVVVGAGCYVFGLWLTERAELERWWRLLGDGVGPRLGKTARHEEGRS